MARGVPRPLVVGEAILEFVLAQHAHRLGAAAALVFEVDVLHIAVRAQVDAQAGSKRCLTKGQVIQYAPHHILRCEAQMPKQARNRSAGDTQVTQPQLSTGRRMNSMLLVAAFALGSALSVTVTLFLPGRLMNVESIGQFHSPTSLR